MGTFISIILKMPDGRQMPPSIHPYNSGQIASFMQYQPISVGVITIKGRETALEKLLTHLNKCFRHYPEECELVICNNSERSYTSQINGIVSTTKTADFCTVSVLQSSENNIAVARNILFNESANRLLAFIDDDEYPTDNWLTELAKALNNDNTHAVAGPVIASYPDTTPGWIINSDLHNTANRQDGSTLEFAATCNLLIDKQGVPQPVFDVDYGKSGGSDTEFFMRNIQAGMIVRWASNALVLEDVEPSRANTRFMIRRFMAQGQVFRRIKTLHEKIPNQFLFSARAVVVGLGSLPIAALLLIVKRKTSGQWLKRAFFNFGKVIKPRKFLYG